MQLSLAGLVERLLGPRQDRRLNRMIARRQWIEAELEHLRQELKMARQVQESLLPATSLTPPGLSVAACFRPAQAVGGDTYDLVELPDGRLLVAIADVCGQGLAAALLSVAVQHGIRQFAQPDPAAALAGVNQLLFEKAPEEMFATAACVVIDPHNGSAAVAVAGHPPPLCWDDSRRRLIPISAHGPALGLRGDWTGPTEQWQLSPNDTLILYTDGVLDAKLDKQERLGDERLAELLGRAAPVDAPEWVERLRCALDDCLELPDDVTIVAIRREPSLIPAAPPVSRIGRGGCGSERTRRGAGAETSWRTARCHRMSTVRETEAPPSVGAPRIGP